MQVLELCQPLYWIHYGMVSLNSWGSELFIKESFVLFYNSTSFFFRFLFTFLDHVYIYCIIVLAGLAFVRATYPIRNPNL